MPVRDVNFSHIVGLGRCALLMMRFASKPKYDQLENAIRNVLSSYGIDAVRADDRFSAPTLWESLKNDMDRCGYGVAILDDKASQGINPNVLIEMGYMLARKANLLLLKEQNLSQLPSDILGHLYREFDPERIDDTARHATLEWLRDLGIAKRNGERLVVFVSHGGTCRCAISKAILLRSLSGRALPFDLNVMSLAARFGEARGASKGARKVVKTAFGDDVLEHHEVRKTYPALFEEADIFLCAETSLKHMFPQEKTLTIGEFFGNGEDIVNPWPSDDSPEAAMRYNRCFEQLQTLIQPHCDKLISHLYV